MTGKASTDVPATGEQSGTAEQPSNSTPEVASSTPKPEEVDWKAKYEEQREHSRTWEKRAKDNSDAAKKLAEVERQAMSDAEKAVAEARDEARKQALAEVGAELVDANVRAAAAGRNVDVDTLLSGLDRSQFLGDDGKPDTAKITDWVGKIAPAAKPAAADLGQGARPLAPGQLGRDALKNMTPEQIVEAQQSGQLNDLMMGK